MNGKSITRSNWDAPIPLQPVQKAERATLWLEGNNTEAAESHESHPAPPSSLFALRDALPWEVHLPLSLPKMVYKHINVLGRSREVQKKLSDGATWALKTLASRV
jgi:hypothetical protein